MVRVVFRALILIGVCMLQVSVPVQARDVVVSLNPESRVPCRYVDREVIVVFEPGVNAAAQASLATQKGATTRRGRSSPDWCTFEYPASIDAFAVAQQLMARPDVRRAFPNFVGTFQAVPTDPGIDNWWFFDTDPSDGQDDISNISTLGLKQFWEAYDDNAHDDVVIVLFDTGLDLEHEAFNADIGFGGPEDMSNRIVLFESFTSQAERDSCPPNEFNEFSSPRDQHGHGTRMAGVMSAIADQNGVAGVAYDNPLWVFKVGTDDAVAIELGHLLTALDDLVARTVEFPGKRFVASLSLGFEEHQLDATAKSDLHSRIAALDTTGKTILVAASGNEEHAFWKVGGGPPPTCQPSNKNPDWEVVYPAAFSGCHIWNDYESIVAVGAVRLFTATETSECACNGPSTDAKWRGWSEFSRFKAPEPGHPACSPIVDVLAPGGAKDGLGGSDCDGLNVFSTHSCEPLTCAPAVCSHHEWSWGTSYSTALTSAVIAGIWSRDITLSPGDLKDLIMTHADRVQVYEGADGLRGPPLTFGTFAECTDPPDPDNVLVGPLGSEDQVFEFTGKAGAGVLNAGRAIENVAQRDVQYVTGGVLDANLTLSGADAFVLAGDLTVPAGVTLTVGPGTGSLQPVLVESTIDGVEILVQGTLELQGDVSFATYDRGTDVGVWKGLRIDQQGSLVTNGNKLRVRNAETGLTMAGTGESAILEIGYCDVGLLVTGDLTLAAGTSLYQNATRAIDSTNGNYFLSGGLDVLGSPGLTVKGSTKQVLIDGGVNFTAPTTISSRLPTPMAGDWTNVVILSTFTSSQNVTVRHATTGIAHTEPLTLTNWAVQDCGTGIVAAAPTGDLDLTACTFQDITSDALVRNTGASLTLNGATFLNVGSEAIDMSTGLLTIDGPCTLTNTGGIIVSGLTTGSQLRDLTVTGSSRAPLVLMGGDVIVGPNLVIDGSGPIHSGVVIHSGATVTSGGFVSVEHCALEGVSIIGGTVNGTWELVSRFNGANGLKLDGTSMTLGEGTNLSGNASNGLYVLDGTVTATYGTFNANGVAGAAIEGAGHAVIRESDVMDNLIGVSVSASGTANLGITDGQNNITGSTSWHVANLNMSQTVQAVGNYWGLCPPKAPKFYGQVNYASCLQNPPN